MDKNYLKLLKDYYKLLAENTTLRFGLEKNMKEQKKTDYLTTTKERVLSAAEKCESAKKILKEIFPEVFEDEPILPICCQGMINAWHAEFVGYSKIWKEYVFKEGKGWYLKFCPWCGKKT